MGCWNFFVPNNRICIKLPLRRTLPLKVILLNYAKYRCLILRHDNISALMKLKFYSQLMFYSSACHPDVGGIYINFHLPAFLHVGLQQFFRHSKLHMILSKIIFLKTILLFWFGLKTTAWKKSGYSQQFWFQVCAGISLAISLEIIGTYFGSHPFLYCFCLFMFAAGMLLLFLLLHIWSGV
jgi:hypothetical protein